MGILEVLVRVVGVLLEKSYKMDSKRIWIFVAIFAVFAASQVLAIKCYVGTSGEAGGISVGNLLRKEETCGEGIFQCKNSTTGAVGQKVTTFECGTTVNQTLTCTKTTTASIDTNACFCNTDLCNGSEILKSGNFILFLMLIPTLMMKF